MEHEHSGYFWSRQEMLQATLVVVAEAAGMAVVEPMTVILTLMDVGVEEAQDMFIPLLQLNYPNGCLLNSTHYLTNAQTIAGNTSFTSPTGSAETGHTGSGFCRITNLNPTQYGLYVKTNSGWKHIDL